MWTSVYMAQSREDAEKMRLTIEQSGIIVMLKQINNEDSSAECFELLVPKAELETALSIIIEK